MLTRITAENQLTLPASITAALGWPVEYFDVELLNGRVILTPLQPADASRAQLAELAITERDVSDAIDWARANSPGTGSQEKSR